MATVTGFQQNTTIHAAFWIYKPDPAVDPVSKEQFVEVNSLQYIETNAASVVASVSSTQVAPPNVLTCAVDTVANVRAGMPVIFSGLTGSPFLNGEVVTVSGVGPGLQFTAGFATGAYGPTPEPAGALATDAQARTAWLYYADTNVSTSQAPRKLEGVVASRFVYDMEALF